MPPIKRRTPQVRTILTFMNDAERPVYGLEIMNGTGLPSGLIYPALRRLVRSGLVRFTHVVDDGPGPTRKYYAITERGKSRLEEWAD